MAYSAEDLPGLRERLANARDNPWDRFRKVMSAALFAANRHGGGAVLGGLVGAARSPRDVLQQAIDDLESGQAKGIAADQANQNAYTKDMLNQRLWQQQNQTTLPTAKEERAKDFSLRRGIQEDYPDLASSPVALERVLAQIKTGQLPTKTTNVNFPTLPGVAPRGGFPGASDDVRENMQRILETVSPDAQSEELLQPRSADKWQIVHDGHGGITRVNTVTGESEVLQKPTSKPAPLTPEERRKAYALAQGYSDDDAAYYGATGQFPDQPDAAGTTTFDPEVQAEMEKYGFGGTGGRKRVNPPRNSGGGGPAGAPTQRLTSMRNVSKEARVPEFATESEAQQALRAGQIKIGQEIKVGGRSAHY